MDHTTKKPPIKLDYKPISLCYSFEEETPLCFFLQVRETTWTPSLVQIFINRGGDDYHLGIRKTREPAALGWDSTALPRGGMKKLQSPNESLSRCWWVSSDGLENRHCCKTQNIQFSVFKWSILWPSRIRCWVSPFKISSFGWEKHLVLPWLSGRLRRRSPQNFHSYVTELAMVFFRWYFTESCGNHGEKKCEKWWLHS